MKPLRYIIPVIALAAILAGCGVYSFSASGKAAFGSLHVTQFQNQTLEYQLTDRLTDAVVDAFIRDNTVTIMEPSQAEAVMRGTLVSYRREPFTYDQQDIVSEYAVKVALRVEVVKTRSEDIIWEKEFFAQGVYDANSESEETGQQRVITLLTADIMSFTTKSW